MFHSAMTKAPNHTYNVTYSVTRIKPSEKLGKLRGCDVNPAVTYLVLAGGTSGDNQPTGWSTRALHRHAGITRERDKAAIEN